MNRKYTLFLVPGRIYAQIVMQLELQQRGVLAVILRLYSGFQNSLLTIKTVLS
jgi:hypothetical protein